MASPRSMFSGVIQIGLLTIPITIGKATGDERESSLIQVCVHGNKAHRIDRSERCDECKGRPSNKGHAVALDDGRLKILDAAEFEFIEGTTNTGILEVEDVQPIERLPLMYAMSTYYVRHDKNCKAEPVALAHLVAALSKTRMGLACKWGNSSKQKLCVINAESGVLILRVVPFLTNVRPASKMERDHFRIKLQQSYIDKMVELLEAVRNPEGFDYPSYNDEGLRLRQEAVQKVLDGIKPEPKRESKVQTQQVDIFAEIDRAIAAKKETTSNV